MSACVKLKTPIQAVRLAVLVLKLYIYVRTHDLRECLKTYAIKRVIKAFLLILKALVM